MKPEIALAFNEYGKATKYVCFCGMNICECKPVACNLVTGEKEEMCYRWLIEYCPVCDRVTKRTGN